MAAEDDRVVIDEVETRVGGEVGEISHADFVQAMTLLGLELVTGDNLDRVLTEVHIDYGRVTATYTQVLRVRHGGA